MGIFGKQLIKIDYIRRLFFYPTFDKKMQSDLDLLAIFGFKEPVNLKKLRKLVKSKKIDECVVEILQYMNLPVKVMLSETSSMNFGNKWRNSDSEIILGETLAGAAAQVKIPNNLPSFGSEKLNGFPIEIRIDSSIKKMPDVFIYTMAHELSHILLYSINHKERSSEPFTDLTAMACGFHDAMFWGRSDFKYDFSVYHDHIKTSTVTKRFGYLKDAEFNYAYDKIKSKVDSFKRQKKKIKKQIVVRKKELLKVQKTYFGHQALLKQIELQPPIKIEIDDSRKIGEIYRNQHLESCKSSIAEYSKSSKIFYENLEFLWAASDENQKKFSGLETQLFNQFREIWSYKGKLDDEIKVIKKYVNLRCTISIQFRLYVQWFKSLLQIWLK